MKSLQNLSYKTLFTILFFSLAGIVFFLRIGKPAKKVSAAWWDEMWHYRKAISIENTSGSDLTDFQVSISIGTSQLITEGKMQTDCDDIRITDINGNVLPHWIEENNPGCNQLTDTKIWLKANSLPTSGATIYIYYGNSSANNYENGNNVFEFFDDFSNNLNKWINVSNSNWSITDGILNITPPSNNNYIVANKSIGVSGLVIESQIKSSSGTNHPGLIWHANTLSSSNHRNDHIYLRPHAYNTSTNIQPAYFNGSLGTFSNTTGLFNSDVWHNIKIEIPSSNSIKYYRNDINEANFANQQYQSNTYTGIAAHAGTNMQFDNFRIRKYTSSEPIPSIQSEELSPAPIAYWKFDEGVGTTAYDSVGFNTSVLTGSTLPLPEWQNEDQCISGKCLSFDNVDDGVNVNKNFTDLTDYTMCSWVKPTGNHKNYTGTIISSGSWNHEHWAFGINQANTRIQTRRADGVNSPYWNYSFPINKWTYACITRSESSITAFINGKQLGSSYIGTTGNINSNASNTYIGRETYYNGWFTFNGLIDEVKIYPYARTADQIKQDYNSRGSLSGAGVNLGVRSNTAPSLKSSLIAHWKFDENNGTIAYDSVNSNNGTFGTGLSSPTWVSGKNNSGLNFDGNDYISTSSNIGISGNTSRTITGWFRQTSTAKKNIVGWGAQVTGQCFDIIADNGHIYGHFYGSGYDTATGAPSYLLNTWYHFALTYDGSSAKFYLNGIHTNSKTLTLNTSNSVFYIGAGAWTNTNYFNGLIDEVKIYNTALTAEEVKQDYNQGSVVQFGTTNQTIGGTTTSLEYCIPGDTSYCAPPVAQWDFEENTGTVAKDISGNNNNGTFGTGNSAPTWSLGQNNKGAGVNFINDASYIDNTSIIYGDNYTIETWIKPTDLGIIDKFGRTIIASSPTYNYPIWLLLRGNQIRAYSYSNSTASYFIDSNFNNIQTNNWYHISLSATKNGQASLYINGILDSTFTAGAQAATQKLTIADLRPGRNISFKGSIDQVKIYNYIRTPAQIAYDYNKGAPIGHWKLDECQGLTAFDSSGLGNTGTIIIGASGSQNTIGTCAVGTSAAWTNGAVGKINSSLNFDGNDDFVTVSNTKLKGLTELTISLWVKRNINRSNSGILGENFSGTPTSRLINVWGDYGNPGITIWDSSGNTDSIHSNTPHINGVWEHITVMFKGGEYLKIFRNGIENASKNTTITKLNENPAWTNLYIGKYASYVFNGQIDDVRIYNYALTSEQVKQVYNDGAVNFR